MKTTIGFIGGGNMGACLISGMRKSARVSVCESNKAREAWLKKNLKVSCFDLEILMKRTRIIVLAVKPQSFDTVLKEVKKHLRPNHVIVSIAAGITTTYIEKRLGKIRVIRTMPNLPAQVSQGVTGICRGKQAKASDLALARRLFNSVGDTVIVNEKLMDAITAVSGSGPAYVFLFVEMLNHAAHSLGLTKKQSEELVMQTIKGSLTLLENQKQDASVLRRRVTSKGGTTEAALKVLKNKKVEQAFKEALKAAAKRAKQLSR